MMIRRSVGAVLAVASLGLVAAGPAPAQNASGADVRAVGGDPLLDAYRRLHGPDTLLAQAPPATGQHTAEPAGAHGEHTSMESINKQLNNPVSSLWSLNFQHNFVFSEGKPSTGECWFYNLNFQPVLPIRLTEGWNLIARPVFPVLAGVDVPEPSPPA